LTQAREFMTKDVVVVSPDTSIREIARLLLDHSISAVPVVDASGAPMGMVSDGDLIGRAEADREARRDWWLDLMAEGEALAPEFLASRRDQVKTARDIMSAPTVTIDQSAEVCEIVDLFAAYRIKRVPVVHDGRITGIVSRADVLRVWGAQARASMLERQSHAHGPLYETFSRLDDQFFGSRPPQPDYTRQQPQPTCTQHHVSGADFRALVADFEHKKAEDEDEAIRAVAERRREKIKELIALHITDQTWQALLSRASQGAEHGEKEIILTRFPSGLCSDGGRAINICAPEWPATLLGEPAEIYLRWEHELKPGGFHLAARVLDFPGGMLGDIGLFLLWGT
jgi:CBS domain-containing protein